MRRPAWSLLPLLAALTIAPGLAMARPAPAHPSSDPLASHRPPYPVRFEGLVLGQTLSTLPRCAPNGSTKTLCYATTFDGEKAPDLSPSVHTVVLMNLPAFLPSVRAGHPPPTALETDRQHRGLASVVDGRIEEIKIMIPNSRIQEAADLLTQRFPRTQLDHVHHLMVGENYAIGFAHAPDHVIIALLSRVFVETLEKDARAIGSGIGNGEDAPDDVAPPPGDACPVPDHGPSA